MDEIDAEERELLTEGAAALVALRDSTVPRLVAAAEEVLERELGEIQPATIDNVRWSFIQLFDASAAYYLVRYLTADNAAPLLQLFVDATSTAPQHDAIEVELRRLQALYGQRMALALRAWNTTPDDWSGTTREVAYDLATQTYKIRFQIAKNSGEQFNLVSEPASIMNLATSLVRTLNFLPDPSGIGESITLDFRTEVTRLLDALTPRPAAAATAPDDTAAAATDAGAAGDGAPPSQG